MSLATLPDGAMGTFPYRRNGLADVALRFYYCRRHRVALFVFGSVCFCSACMQTRHLCTPCTRVVGRRPNNCGITPDALIPSRREKAQQLRNHSRRANTESSGEGPTTAESLQMR